MNSKFLLVETSNIVTAAYRIERNIEDDGVLAELKNNIETYGIKVPLIVSWSHDGSFQLIDGHRRLQVAIALGMEKIPCMIEEGEKSVHLAFSVNIHREDLTSIEIGKMLIEIYNHEKQQDNGFRYASLTKMVNKSKAYVSQHIGYIEKLSPVIQKDILDNKRMIDKNILNRIYVLDDENQKSIYDQMIKENLGREEVQKLIDSLKKGDESIDGDQATSSLQSDVVMPITGINISNLFVEFRLKGDPLSEDQKEQFAIELKALLEKYKLGV